VATLAEATQNELQCELEIDYDSQSNVLPRVGDKVIAEIDGELVEGVVTGQERSGGYRDPPVTYYFIDSYDGEELRIIEDDVMVRKHQ
jgi:hypothetical protein